MDELQEILKMIRELEVHEYVIPEKHDIFDRLTSFIESTAFVVPRCPECGEIPEWDYEVVKKDSGFTFTGIRILCPDSHLKDSPCVYPEPKQTLAEAAAAFGK